MQQNYYHTSNQMGHLCRLVNPPNRDPPLPEIYSLIQPSEYGQMPLRPRAITLQDQLQATADVHNKQMHPPPGKALFFADERTDDAGLAGITLHPDRTFTLDDLENYSPGCTAHLTQKQKQQIVQAHANVAHLFEIPDPKPSLIWPFQYVHPTAAPPPYIVNLRKAIRGIPAKSRHRQFSINILHAS